MDRFQGFDRDTFLLLAENKFNDSKPYYESVKETLKQKAILPMRAIAEDLQDELFALDEQMQLVPSKMVSRIRRDTRRAKDKNMYRDNVWMMFMRHKYEWHYQPCMWFEIMPGGYTIGVGAFYGDAAYFEHFRRRLRDNQRVFRAALKKVHAVGAVEDLEQYAKDKPGEVAKDLKPYYNAKNLYFIRYSSDMEPLFDGSVLNELRECIRAYKPMYQFLLQVMEDAIAEKGQNYDDQRL